MIARVLMQITNAMMATIVFYVNGAFFHHFEMTNLHIIFSNAVFIGCTLSFTSFLAFVVFKVESLEKVFPYDSAPIFIALIGSLITNVPILL